MTIISKYVTKGMEENSVLTISFLSICPLPFATVMAMVNVPPKHIMALLTSNMQIMATASASKKLCRYGSTQSPRLYPAQLIRKKARLAPFIFLVSKSTRPMTAKFVKKPRPMGTKWVLLNVNVAKLWIMDMGSVIFNTRFAKTRLSSARNNPTLLSINPSAMISRKPAAFTMIASIPQYLPNR